MTTTSNMITAVTATPITIFAELDMDATGDKQYQLVILLNPYFQFYITKPLSFCQSLDFVQIFKMTEEQLGIIQSVQIIIKHMWEQ